MKTIFLSLSSLLLLSACPTPVEKKLDASTVEAPKLNEVSPIEQNDAGTSFDAGFSPEKPPEKKSLDGGTVVLFEEHFIKVSRK